MGINAKTSILFFFLFASIFSKAQDGKNLFKTECSSCHVISSQRFVGPGLANVHERHTKEWFFKFVKSSQTVIRSGDPYAVSLFKKYNNILMPDHSLSDTELDVLYEYLKRMSPVKTIQKGVSLDPGKDSLLAQTTVETTEIEVPFEPSKEDVLGGHNLFTGKQRFKNKGPSCISCHHVRKYELITGGGLAKDLTDVYDRLGKEAVGGMILGLPYPRMRSSYKNKPITNEELFQITAFLKDASEQRNLLGHYSLRDLLLIWGFLTSAILIAVFPLLWHKRKKESINKSIYERQIKSSN